MKKIVECVPNFSEGRDEKIINAIADAIRSVEGVSLLDVDPGKSANRTVYTFVGDPKSVVEAALASARVARKLIDMRKHKGEHPRMGAMDVCPFVPVSNVTMDECIECAKDFAQRASKELGIPFYLYEEAQELTYRKSLPDIRQGEYEGLEKKMKLDDWKPDYGYVDFVPEWGATVTGARFFLIAYNVNVLGTNNQAHRIALNLREAGRGDNQPGTLKEVKAIGWQMDEYGLAQISMNLTNYRVTPPHIAYETSKEEAANISVGIAGSELVGLIPLEAMLMAADYYIQKENLFIVDEKQKIKLVIERLGLNSISPFIPEKRIIEYIIKEEPNEPLVSLPLRKFIESVGARTAAPGGGSVAAAVAGLGAGLGSMVSWLTYGVRKFEHLDSKMRAIIPGLNNAMQELISMVDADTNAFNDYMEAMRLPMNTSDEIAIRNQAMQNGLKKAIETPLHVMKVGDNIWKLMYDAARYSNIASKSDIEVGVRCLELGIWGAYRNVLINLQNIQDQEYIDTVQSLANSIYNHTKEQSEAILDLLRIRID